MGRITVSEGKITSLLALRREGLHSRGSQGKYNTSRALRRGDYRKQVLRREDYTLTDSQGEDYTPTGSERMDKQ